MPFYWLAVKESEVRPGGQAGSSGFERTPSLEPGDDAMAPGGIDLNARNMKVKANGTAVVDAGMPAERFSGITEFRPVIIRMEPVLDLKTLF
jgi:hypothetical protein